MAARARSAASSPTSFAPNGGGCLSGAFDCGDGPGLNDTQWIFHYRLTGSGNGIREHDTFSQVFDQNGDEFDADMDGATDDDQGNSSFADNAVYNRLNLVTAGVLQGIGNPANRSGAPLVPVPGSFEPGVTGDGSGAGFHIDFSTADVPLSWFGIVAGENSPIRTPGATGYGGNPRPATDKDGNPVAFGNQLRPLNRLNTNLGNPDSFTVYDFGVAVVPVAALVNYGVGMDTIAMSDLRNLAATGRRLNGENLTKITRDSGSGTRNAFMNGIGLDPSFGRGENIGLRTSSSDNDRVGPDYQPSNKGGSSRMDATVQNTRLGVGHTGARASDQQRLPRRAGLRLPRDHLRHQGRHRRRASDHRERHQRRSGRLQRLGPRGIRLPRRPPQRARRTRRLGLGPLRDRPEPLRRQPRPRQPGRGGVLEQHPPLHRGLRVRPGRLRDRLHARWLPRPAVPPHRGAGQRPRRLRRRRHPADRHRRQR